MFHQLWFGPKAPCWRCRKWTKNWIVSAAWCSWEVLWKRLTSLTHPYIIARCSKCWEAITFYLFPPRGWLPRWISLPYTRISRDGPGWSKHKHTHHKQWIRLNSNDIDKGVGFMVTPWLLTLTMAPRGRIHQELMGDLSRRDQIRLFVPWESCCETVDGWCEDRKHVCILWIKLILHILGVDSLFGEERHKGPKFGLKTFLRRVFYHPCSIHSASEF